MVNHLRFLDDKICKKNNSMGDILINESLIPNEIIMNHIYNFRDKKVMLDKDLAELYQVSTSNLNKAVKRNLKRFPDDFMFQLTQNEFNLIFQNGTSSWGGRRKLPFAFTEEGVTMLSGVLNSDRAILVNIQIMRVFSIVRKMLSDNTELRLAIEEMRKNLKNNTKNIELVFQYLDELIEKKDKNIKPNRIGYKIPNKVH